MPKFYIGNTQVKKLYHGNTKIKKVYRGNTKIYSGGFAVTYQIDTGNSVVIEVDEGADCIANAPTATKSGWTLLGWREDTTASSSVLSSKTADSEGIVLYAVFKQTITLSYNGNSATSGSTASQTADRYYNNGNSTNASFTLRANGYTRTNYSFAKWAQGSASGTKYSPGASVTLSANTTFYAYWVQTVKNYEYTGGMQSFTAPIAGTYTLEVWGAQGYAINNQGGSSTAGLGGYAYGNVVLSANQIIYIGVGGAGSYNWDNGGGGYNGGGNCRCGGGGGTHIGKSNAIIASTSTSNLFIVAGGGGGAGNVSYSGKSTRGGAGGGTTGGDGWNTDAGTSSGSGGTQSSGGTGMDISGSYGRGAGYIDGNVNACGCGGGGGYYGGAGNIWWGGAGGGSGYIGGVSAPKSMSNGQRSGHGYARVTFVSAS